MMQTAMKKSFKKSTAKITEKQVKNCAGFFIIRSRDSDKNELLETGRVLQRIWLRAVEKDIAISPDESGNRGKGNKHFAV